MNWRNIRLIFQREVRDQLRDQRTLFLIFVLPLLLYPALGIGSVQMQVTFTEQPRTVVILGAEHLPQDPGSELLHKGRFRADLFNAPERSARPQPLDDDGTQDDSTKLDEAEATGRPSEADKLLVVLDTPPTDGSRDARQQQLLVQADAIRADLPEFKKKEALVIGLESQIKALRRRAAPADTAELERLEVELRSGMKELRAMQTDLGAKFKSSGMHLLIIVPDKFGEHLKQAGRELAERGRDLKSISDYPRPDVVSDDAIDKSLLTSRVVTAALKEWERRILKNQLKAAKLPDGLTEPVKPTAVNVALNEQKSDNFWSKLLPALLVIMAMTGAFYPAVDLVAGEKERGTMETLLICPASRTDIVLGKFLTVLSFSCTTVILNLTSMGLTGRHIVSMAGSNASRMGDLTLPSMTSIIWVVVLMLPLAALFSALCLALATLARSSKEGQYYLTPLLMVSMGMTVFCMSPGIEMTPQTAIYAVVPIANVALLLKGLIGSATHDPSLYYFVFPVLAASVAYAAVALWWAIDQFQREEVLFRNTDQFDLRLWIRHLLRDKEPVPTPLEALACFGLIMLLQFGVMQSLNSAISRAGVSKDLAMLQMLLVQQVAVIAATPLIMGAILTSGFARTFKLYWPQPKYLLAGLVLPFALQPLSSELLHAIPWPEMPEQVRSVLAAMTTKDIPLWLIVLTFAGAPAICEEIAFRGFLLSGFSRRGRFKLGVVVSGLAFGLMHMIPQQVFNASLLGIVLGALAVRSNSLLPGIVFHFLYNSISVISARVGSEMTSEQFTQIPSSLLWRDADGATRYGWGVMIVAAVLAAPLLRWLAGPLTPAVRLPSTPLIPEQAIE